MRAAVLREARADLDLCRVSDPACPEDGVVLKVLAAGVCRSDHHMWSGADPGPLPIIPGHEFCGEVVAVGAQVSRWTVGHRVIAPFILACGQCPSCAAGHQTICPDQIIPGIKVDGAWAEYVSVPRPDQNLAKLPEDMDTALAAGLGCRVTTAWQALTERAGLRPGEWVAVFGTGGVGLAALLLARAIGARVVAVDVVAEKLDLARRLGADAVVDAGDCDAADAVREITGGGANVTIEALGRTETVGAAMRSLAPLGRMVLVGKPTGDEKQMNVPIDKLYMGQLSVHGTRGMPAWRYPSLLSLIDGGQVDPAPLIGRRIALSHVTGELRAMDGPTSPGIAVVTDFLG